MDSIEFEKKVRLPDPAKTLEVVWRLLRRTRFELNATARSSAGVSVHRETLSAKKLAKMEAERQKALGTQYGLRTSFR